MSNLDNFFASLKAPAKPTLPPAQSSPVQNANLPPATQTFKGQQIPANIATKNLVSYDPATGNKTFNLGNAGAGVYTEDKNGNIVNTGHTSYGGEPAVAGNERDDIIPVSLGGANSNPNNIQTIPMSVASPQDKAETAMAGAVKSGAVAPKAAIPAILNTKQQIAGQLPAQGTAANFGAGLKDALGDVFVKPEQKLIADAGTRIAQAGTRAVEPLLPANIQQNIDTNMQKPVHELGVTVDPLGTGMTAAKQIGGQALNAVGAIGNVAMAENPIQTVKGISGAFKDVFGGTQAGAEAGTAVNAVQPKSDLVATTEKPSPQAIKDATPSYSPKISGDYVTNAEGKYVPRVNEAGTLGNRTVNTSASEARAAAEIDKLPEYQALPKNATALQKSQAVYQGIQNEAEGMRTALQAEDKSAPLVSGAKDQVYKNILDNMDGDARDAVISRGQVSNYMNKGIPESDATSLAGKASKTTLGKFGKDVADEMGNYDGTREGLLNLRQNLDNIYEDYRGKQAWGTDNYNALDEMHTNIRDYLNKELSESTTSADVKASLQKQSNLFRAKDVLDAKGAKEPATFGGRHPFAKTLGKRLVTGAAIGLGVGGVAGGSFYTLGKNIVKGVEDKIHPPTPKVKAPAKPKALPKLKL